jgi:hypothetical protein
MLIFTTFLLSLPTTIFVIPSFLFCFFTSSCFSCLLIHGLSLLCHTLSLHRPSVASAITP